MDPRPGLTEWLATHSPPALAWADPLTAATARLFVRRHGWDEFSSTCHLAAVLAWDWWRPERGTFGTAYRVVVRSMLRAAIERRAVPTVPLGGWDGPAPADPAAELRDEAAAVLRRCPRAAPTLRAVMTTDTLTAAARSLGVSRETVRKRLREVRAMLTGAETDVGDDARGDVIVTRPPSP